MDPLKSNSKDISLKPLEITSPRTAEKPGPVGGVSDSCCDAHAPKVNGNATSTATKQEAAESYIPTAVSLLLLLTGIGLDALDVAWFTPSVSLAVFGIAYLLVGGRVIKHAAQNLVKGRLFNEFFLMTLATLGAFYLGEYAEGVAVMLFYVIGEHFQEAAVARSRKSIKALIDNRPESVNLMRNGQVVSVSPSLVQIGDVIQVKPGEKVALDGLLLNEQSTFNTVALTGESRPETKKNGAQVLAGMINLTQLIDLQVTATYENSALAKILRLVEEAGSRKAKTQQFITRFAKVYTPIVVGLAVALTLLPYFFVTDYVFNDWLYRALVFLVISCPCALVISIPLGYFGGIGAASRNGILFKGATYLDVIAKVDTVVLDKTGTLTEGVFQVQAAVPAGIPQEELIAFAAALESKSTHPVAQAITAYADGTASKPMVTNAEEVPGHGMKGRVNGQEILVGNGKLLRMAGVRYPSEMDQLPGTTALVAFHNEFAGYFSLGDQIKEDAATAVQQLKELGIEQIVMLSGDKHETVQQVAQQVGIPHAYGALLPADKVAHVQQLKQESRKVATAGDGINDAPVLALSDVGIAMGALGSDAAIETADVVIQTDHPSKIATAIRIGRKTKQIVWQNIGLAFGVKLLVLLLGSFGVATLWEAVFADVGVAFLAILNAVRIQHTKF